MEILCINKVILSYPTLPNLPYPANRAFLSGKSLSTNIVVHVSGISRCWLVYVPKRNLCHEPLLFPIEQNKPAMRNTRHDNDNVHAKGLARKKRSASRVNLPLLERGSSWSKLINQDRKLTIPESHSRKYCELIKQRSSPVRVCGTTS